MKLKKGRINVKFDFLFFVFIAYLLTVNIKKRILLTLLFSILHETCHLCCLLILGDDNVEIYISFTGMKIKRNEDIGFSLINESITALSAPVFNLIAGVLFYFINRTYGVFSDCVYINFVLFFINVLPVKTLDGGRFLFYITGYFKNETFADKVLTVTGGTVCVLLIILSVVFNKNVSLFAVSAYILLFYIDGLIY